MAAKHTYQRILKFLITDIWHLDMSELSIMKARMVRYLKVMIITIKNFGNDKMALQATSLSFLSAMAMVPIVSLMFAITNGFGLSGTLESLLYSIFQGNEQVIELILQFANNIIITSQHGLFGLISALFLLSTIIWLMLSIEKGFNDIWKVKAGKLRKRMLYYLILLFAAPVAIFLILFLGIIYTGILDRYVVNIDKYIPISSFVSWLTAYGVVVVVLTGAYKFIPNAKVKLSAAFNSSIVLAVIFIIVQYFYMETQLLVSGLNAVYGVFAAIPLFLVWLSISWTVILFGAELSHAYQNVDDYKIDRYG
jgi:Predicted membrane protein